MPIKVRLSHASIVQFCELAENEMRDSPWLLDSLQPQGRPCKRASTVATAMTSGDSVIME